MSFTCSASGPESDIHKIIRDFHTACIIGHRTSGKTTTARQIAQILRWEFIDLDAHIEALEQKSAAELVAENPSRFRALENLQLAEILQKPSLTPRIIAVGAGCQKLPPGPLYVWLERDGWQESALTERQRLHPELDFAAELQTMISEREPRWQAAAHLRYCTPRTRTPERVATHLATLISLAANAYQSSIAKKTYLVPIDDTQLTRALHDANALGMAGVELRSDFFSEIPPTQSTPILASLRTHEPSWLNAFSLNTALDIDLQFLPAALNSPDFSTRRPTRFLLSTHPSSVQITDVDALLTAARHLESSHPHLTNSLVLKYAPHVETIADLQRALAFTQKLQNLGYATTFLPQNPRFFWIRPLLAHGFSRPANATNYMPVGISTPASKKQNAWQRYDLQKWLPHLTLITINSFDALIGDPVDTSIGEIWHRTFAESDSSTQHGYVAIPITPDELPETLPLLHQLGFRGLSVTSPLKRAILEQPDVENPEKLPAANTLRRTPQGWLATDTDSDGMTATLNHLQQAGIQPGPTAIFGRGGVSPAITRALTHNGWPLTDHISARTGWPHNTQPPKYTLIINAGGPGTSAAHQKPPETHAWLDLHYNDVAPATTHKLHLAGDIFFDAQARAQREFWRKSDQ